MKDGKRFFWTNGGKLVETWFRNLITKVTTMPGADIESDHIPLRADIILRLSRPKEETVRKTLQPKVLKDEERRSLYEEHLNKELESIRSINDTNEHWLKL
ncbi:hypothetical protein HHI36_014179 [Cryptolaemus montrouzieri]|uniref:Uncharacterized protein n=1 Tax=Cryptolaemus montrouzieri TaxID=559131 RepID=A0ABD2N2F0_9CUCU